MSSGEVITTDQEKMEMYMMCSKKALAEMLIEANKAIVRQAYSSEDIHNVITNKVRCEYCNDSGAAPFNSIKECPLCNG